ncbi:hypothetical protein ACIRYZ_27510 [Kitasatospora sp. NPDC101155]|uniref:hypothetical protein n=1 Tax=Kitasatospora sp. NPDC101155 TaxID=3364097 RepID=UPI00381A47E1
MPRTLLLSEFLLHSDFHVGPDEPVFVPAGDRLSYEKGEVVVTRPTGERHRHRAGNGYWICSREGYQLLPDLSANLGNCQHLLVGWALPGQRKPSRPGVHSLRRQVKHAFHADSVRRRREWLGDGKRTWSRCKTRREPGGRP